MENILTLSSEVALSIITSGRSCPLGTMRAVGPSTSDTTPLQSTALCIFPFTDSICGDLLAWLMLLLRRSRGLWGTNSEPRLLSLSPKMLCSSSANSVSDPRSLPRPLKLKRLVRLLRRAENKEPRMLSGDCRKNKTESVCWSSQWEKTSWNYHQIVSLGPATLCLFKRIVFERKAIQQKDQF